MALVHCPTCAKPIDPQASRWLPFCSERCRQIDLNRWLKEEISLPYHELADDGRSDRLPDKDDEQ
ncbi:MAG: DNA gyrase inhibitor YacG [Pirellulales bacterium]